MFLDKDDQCADKEMIWPTKKCGVSLSELLRWDNDISCHFLNNPILYDFAAERLIFAELTDKASKRKQQKNMKISAAHSVPRLLSIYSDVKNNSR